MSPNSTPLNIEWEADKTRTLVPGDFNAELKLPERKLLVPEDLYRRCTSLGWKFGAFLGMTYNAEDSLAKFLGWTLDQLRAARTKLIGQLRGQCDDFWLDPQPPMRPFVGGALIPPKKTD